MAIADKLTELQATKTAIKTAIEEKGQSLTNVPFTQYAEVIKAIQGGGGGSETPNIWGKALKNLTSFYNLFKNLSDMTDADLATSGISKDNTSQVTSVEGMFNRCSSITRTPEMDLQNCTNMKMFVERCTGLKSLPMYDTKKVTNFQSCIYNCVELEEIPAWDVRSGTNFGYGVSYNRNVKNIWLKNIKANFDLTTCDSVTQECIIHIIKELRNTGSAKTLSLGSTNMKKITGDNAVYVKTIAITDEMRAEDDLIDEKSPFVVCESTDEGAMLITEYAKTKNWNIAG